MNRGKWIVFEGIDGCGKSTQHARAVAWLRARNVDVLATREPTDGPHGRRIRAMAKSGEGVAPETELEWFFADRREHMRDVVRPALAAGRCVLSDRSYFSTVAYQGARGLDARSILADSEAEFGRPDAVLLFELDVETATARIDARGAPRETVFEERAFQEEVAARFESLMGPGIVRLDARRPERVLARDVQTVLRRVLDC